MKLLKNKKIILGTGVGLVVLTTSIVTPIVLLNKDDMSTKNDEDIVAIQKVLDAKTGNDLIIMLPSHSTGNIIGKAANKNAILAKLRILIDSSNTSREANHPSLKGTSIGVTMSTDTPISTSPQAIIVSITKSGGRAVQTTKTFQVRRHFTADEDIAAIKEILDAKRDDDLVIKLPSGATGNIIDNVTNKNAILRRLGLLIDPSNTNGDANHVSLRGTSIGVSMSTDAPISTSPQAIIVSITKSGGRAVQTTKTFQVRRHFTADEDIAAIKEILDAKMGDDLELAIQPNALNINIMNATNKKRIEREVRKSIDPSNTNGDPGHPSLLGTTITLKGGLWGITLISLNNSKRIVITISKTSGTSIDFNRFLVRARS